VALVNQCCGVIQFDQVIQGGYDRAVAELGFVSRKQSADVDRLTVAAGLAEDGYGLVVIAAVGSDSTGVAIDALADAHPDARFVVLDEPAHRPNVTRVVISVKEATFLAGVAAANATRTGTIGFIGGADTPVIWPWEAGFVAGARSVDPDIEILRDTIDPGACDCGFNNIPGATALATAQYEAGADVILQAAGESGFGVFAAAAEVSERTGIHRWAIGADVDQHTTITENPSIGPVALEWQPHILTSVLKRTDTAIHDVVATYARGDALGTVVRFGLENGGADLSFTGGFLDEHRAALDRWRARLVAGEVLVPCIPEHARDDASRSGLGADYCST
jgi:basic membrane protein A